MIVTLVQKADVEAVRGELARLGLWVGSVETSRAGAVHLVVSGASPSVDPSRVERIPGVASVSAPASPHPRVDAEGPEVVVAGVPIGAARPAIVAGPCAVESEEQIARIAEKLAARGVRLLRGGAFKPRTSPYSFQGRGREALGWLRRAADAADMRVVTEVLSEADVEVVAAHADMLQIGSRNMHSFALLKAVGAAKRPVLLKRSMAATVEEWLLAGEYLLTHGAASVVYCERGVRGFDPSTRNVLDLGAVALLSHVHRLPVLVDPSHGTGRRDLVVPMARAALAAGAAGVMIEVHDDPAAARSDGPQALDPDAIGAIAALVRGEAP
jgi:3-deoxy-7-phosphoheptulonate synthase